MLMMCEPIVECIEAITAAGFSEQKGKKLQKPHRIYFSPRGKD